VTTSRRGFLGLLTGVAAASTFATRFPLLPREVHQWQVTASGGPKLWPFLVGLMRDDRHEVKAHGYLRVHPSKVHQDDRGVAEIRAVFPTVTTPGYTARGMGLYRDDRLVCYQAFTDSWGVPLPVTLVAGNTIEVSMTLDPDMGAMDRATMRELLGLS
jgi:hypothetical protein